MNSFEYVTVETEQVQPEQRESQTILRTSIPAPASETNLEEQTSMPAPAPQTDLEEQSPPADVGDSKIVQSESIPQSTYELSYACLLIPRFPDHYLTGDITEDLPRWMKEICISYGWRLDAVMIRPGYLQWVMTVPLTASPAHFMRIIRQQTSQKILEDYPRYKQKNLSGDFWAPGFSVVPRSQFQSTENISNFILETRKNQGIS